MDWLAAKMRDANFTVAAMHGDMPQKEREAIMGEFRGGSSRVLITTDVWARGIDVQQARARAPQMMGGGRQRERGAARLGCALIHPPARPPPRSLGPALRLPLPPPPLHAFLPTSLIPPSKPSKTLQTLQTLLPPK